MGLGARVGPGSSVGMPEPREAVPIGCQAQGRGQGAGGRSLRLGGGLFTLSSIENWGTWMKPGRPDTSKLSNFYLFVFNRKPLKQCPQERILPNWRKALPRRCFQEDIPLKAFKTVPVRHFKDIYFTVYIRLHTGDAGLVRFLPPGFPDVN